MESTKRASSNDSVHVERFARDCVALIRELTHDLPLGIYDLPTAEQSAPLRQSLRDYVFALRSAQLRPEQALLMTKGVIAEAMPRSTEHYPRLAEAVVTWAIQAYFEPT